MEIDLYKVIKSRQALTDDHMQYIMYQLCRGIYYLHSANIIHRDLKPSNILANENCDIKMWYVFVFEFYLELVQQQKKL